MRDGTRVRGKQCYPCGLNGFVGEILRLCTLDGVKYIGFRNRHIAERIFWIIAVLSCFGLAAHNIRMLYLKYLKNPIITTFQPKETDIENVPFPAITLCNVNILKGPAMLTALGTLTRELVKTGYTLNTSEATEAVGVMEFLAQICLSAQSFRRVTLQKLTDARVQDDFLLNLTNDLKQLELQIHKSFGETFAPHKFMHVDSASKFLHQASHLCEDMLVQCTWRGKTANCRQLFREVYTPHGACCTFNMMPKFLMRKHNPKGQTAEQTRRMSGLSEHDSGWETFGNGNLNASYGSYPQRQYSGGQQNGLSLLVDPELHLYSTCITNDGSGFRVTSHSPSSIPSVMEFGVAVPPRREVFVEIEPEVIVASDNLLSVDVDKRGCYFASEKAAKLQQYKFYTAGNCLEECITKRTILNCSCVRVHMQKSKGEHYCSAKQLEFECADTVQATLSRKGVGGCKCYPACTDIKYKLSVSSFPIRDNVMTELIMDTKDRKENLSIIHLYIGTESIYVKERKTVVTISDLLAEAAGLIGLTLGFSIMNLVEILYFFTLRIWFYLRFKWRGNMEKS